MLYVKSLVAGVMEQVTRDLGFAKEVALALAGLAALAVPVLFGMMAAHSVQAQSQPFAVDRDSAAVAPGAEDHISVYFEGDGVAPGRMDFELPVRLLKAIAAHGGFKDFAHTNKIQILRDGKLLMTVRYKDIIRGEHLESNPYLKDGDHVLVP